MNGRLYDEVKDMMTEEKDMMTEEHFYLDTEYFTRFLSFMEKHQIFYGQVSP